MSIVFQIQAPFMQSIYASKSTFLEFLRDFTVRSNGIQQPAAFASNSNSCEKLTYRVFRQL